jgi:hypothetical protein
VHRLVSPFFLKMRLAAARASIIERHRLNRQCRSYESRENGKILFKYLKVGVRDSLNTWKFFQKDKKLTVIY